MADGNLSILESEGYTPVSGLNAGKRVQLFGYLHPTRCKEVLEHLLEQSSLFGMTNLRMGDPNYILWGDEDDEE